MKHKDVNWLEWPGVPSEQVFDDWIKARKSKNHPVLTHTAMKSYSKHVARLVHDNVCDVEMAFACAAEAGWRAIFYSYVIGAINREMDAYAGVSYDQGKSISNHYNNRSSRDMTLHDEMSTDWEN